MSDAEYAKLLKEMATEHAIQANFKARRELERTYFVHHNRRGVRLRAKYRA